VAGAAQGGVAGGVDAGARRRARFRETLRLRPVAALGPEGHASHRAPPASRGSRAESRQDFRRFQCVTSLAGFRAREGGMSARNDPEDELIDRTVEAAQEVLANATEHRKEHGNISRPQQTPATAGSASKGHRGAQCNR